MNPYEQSLIKAQENAQETIMASSFRAKYRGETLGYYGTADDAQAAIDDARTRDMYADDERAAYAEMQRQRTTW